ncbi:MAG TPA: OmpA family protein [Methylosinus sp.]|jgi:outer membrane protein OmpA-like peptidoglycan-associated protein
MTYLVTHFWAWWMSALALGSATALVVARRPERGEIAGWLAWFGLAFLVGLPVAYLHLLSGRAGLWLETGLALFAGFLAGAALGALAGGRSLRDHEGWAAGLVPLALVWIGAGLFGGRSLESDLQRQASSVVEKLGGDPALLEAAGRDVLLPAGVQGRDEAQRRIAQIAGVRRVVEIEAPAPSAPEAPPAEPSSAEPAMAPPEPPSRPPAIESVASPEPVANRAAAEAVPATGELDAEACRKAVAATLAEEPIRFARNGVGIRRASSGALEKVTGLLKRCPSAKVEARGHADDGDPQGKLARARAERVADYLWRMGLERGRLEATVAEARGGAANGGVELIVSPRH